MDTLASVAVNQQGSGGHAGAANGVQQHHNHQGAAPQHGRHFPAPPPASTPDFYGSPTAQQAARAQQPAHHVPQANFTAQGKQDPADILLSTLIDVSKIKYVQNRTTAVLHADEYANSMGISYDEIVALTHKRNRVIKRRHPKQLEEFSVKILMKWMLSVEHFDFPYPTEREKSELCRIANISGQQLNHWFTNARKRIWIPLRKARQLHIPDRTELVRGRQMREHAERQGGDHAPRHGSSAPAPQRPRGPVTSYAPPAHAPPPGYSPSHAGPPGAAAGAGGYPQGGGGAPPPPWAFDAAGGRAAGGAFAPGRIESHDSFAAAAAFPRGVQGVPSHMPAYARFEGKAGLSPSALQQHMQRHSSEDTAFLAAVEAQQGGPRGAPNVSPHSVGVPGAPPQGPHHAPPQGPQGQVPYQQQAQQWLYQQQVQRLVQQHGGGASGPGPAEGGPRGQQAPPSWGVSPHSAVMAAASAAAARGVGRGGSAGKRAREGESSPHAPPPGPPGSEAQQQPGHMAHVWKSSKSSLKSSPSSGRHSDGGRGVARAPSLTLNASHPPAPHREDTRDMGDTPLPSRPIDTERLRAAAGGAAPVAYPPHSASLPLPPRPNGSHGAPGRSDGWPVGAHGGYTPGHPGGPHSYGPPPPGASPGQGSGHYPPAAAYYGGSDPVWDMKGGAHGLSPGAGSYGPSGWTPRAPYGGGGATPSNGAGGGWAHHPSGSSWAPPFQGGGQGPVPWAPPRDGGMGGGTPHSSAGPGGSGGNSANWRPAPTWGANPWGSTPRSQQGPDMLGAGNPWGGTPRSQHGPDTMGPGYAAQPPPASYSMPPPGTHAHTPRGVGL